MSPNQPPVEISEHFLPGDWTEEILQRHVEDYKKKLMDMGAVEKDIEAIVTPQEDGGVDVIVGWTASPPTT